MATRTTDLSPTTVERLTRRLQRRRELVLHVAAAFHDEARNAIGSVDVSDLLDDDWPVPGGGEESLMLAVMADELLCSIDAALRRIDDGSYGWCAGCGGPIRLSRLEAIPTTELCIDCKRHRC